MARSPLSTHLDHLPLFPLPDVLLFPQMRLPLHIFESRYRQMVVDATEDGLPIAIGHLRPAARAGEPRAVYPIVGAGFIEQLERLPDGRFLIELVGMARLRIVGEKELATVPYRVISAESVPDFEVSVPDNQRALEALQRVLLAIHECEPEAGRALSRAVASKHTAGDAANAIASMLDAEPRLRQNWLEERDPVRRLERVTDTLGTFLAQTRQARGPLN